jgi:hypothetical protein
MSNPWLSDVVWRPLFGYVRSRLSTVRRPNCRCHTGRVLGVVATQPARCVACQMTMTNGDGVAPYDVVVLIGEHHGR